MVQSPGVLHFRGTLPTDHSPVDHGGAGGIRNDIQLQSTCAISVYKSVDLYWYSKNCSSNKVFSLGITGRRDHRFCMIFLNITITEYNVRSGYIIVIKKALQI